MASDLGRRRHRDRRPSPTARPHRALDGLRGPVARRWARVDGVTVNDRARAFVRFTMVNGGRFEVTVPTCLKGFEHLLRAEQHQDVVVLVVLTVPGAPRVLEARSGRRARRVGRHRRLDPDGG